MGKKTLQVSLLLCMTMIFGWQVVTAQPEKPVTLQADIIVYDAATGISTADGNVTITQEDGQATGRYAEYNLNTRVGWLEGNVVATKGEAKLTAERVWLRDENHLTAEGYATVTNAGDSVHAPTIDYWSDREFAQTAGGWAKLTQEDGSIITADYMEYDMKVGEGLAENNVTVDAPARNLVGAGDRATYTADRPEKQGELILTGNAWLVQDGNKIIGNTLVVKSDKSASEGRGDVRLDIQSKNTGGAALEQQEKVEQLEAKKEMEALPFSLDFDDRLEHENTNILWAEAARQDKGYLVNEIDYVS